MTQKWAVIGAGRQGPAAAYDLAKFGDGLSIVIADRDISLASKASQHVNDLIGRQATTFAQLDITNQAALNQFLAECQVAIAASPYRLNPLIAHAGINVGCSVFDMGVDTPDALSLHDRNAEASKANVSIVTDCGVAPGLVNILARLLIEENPGTETVRLYCGGLPAEVKPPFYHKVGFSVESLLGEYVDDVESLRGGQVVKSAPLEDLESLDFPGFGPLEAMTTSGGTGTAPYALEGKLVNYEYKTLRYPGHWAAMTFMRDAGFWSEEPISTGEVPRRVSLELMDRAMVEPNSHDVVVTRVVASGPFGSKGYDLVDRFDSETGFSAMQRTTGFSTSIVALGVSSKDSIRGCYSCESAIDPRTFFKESERRGLTIVPVD